MFLERYNNNREKLTKLEYQIIQTIKAEKKLTHETSIHEVARTQNTSVATIMRLVKKLEYNGFVEFKADIIKFWRKDEMKMKQLSMDIIGDTENTLRMLDSIELDKIYNLFKKSERIMIIGYGINHYLARMMEVKLKIMGIDAIHNTNAYYSRLELKTKNCPDFIIALSKTGTTEEVTSVLKDAYQLRIPTLLIAEKSLENHNFYVQHLIETTPSIEDDLYLDLRLQAHVVIEYLLKNLQQQL